MKKRSLTPAFGSPATAVIITGGASGIGLASARAVAAVGRPVALWDINIDKAEESALAITHEFGVEAIGIKVDIADINIYEAAIKTTLEALGKVGGLVHSAGVVDTDSLEGITEDSWTAGINTHLRPLAILTQKLHKEFSKNPNSSIVAITSINATLGSAVNPIYTAAKGGMLSLVRSLADRLAHDGIRINSVSPGQILTPMLSTSIDNGAQYEKRILLERLGDPDEVGRVVRFLLSEEASYITAAEIIVDGGNVSSQR